MFACLRLRAASRLVRSDESLSLNFCAATKRSIQEPYKRPRGTLSPIFPRAEQFSAFDQHAAETAAANLAIGAGASHAAIVALYLRSEEGRFLEAAWSKA